MESNQGGGTRRVIAAWGWVFGWGGVIYALSACSGAALAPYVLPLPFFDKGCHAGAFLVGGFCLSRAVRRSGVRSEWVVFALALVLASLFGASDEWHQLSTPGRSGADFFDWLADTAGAILGALASRFFHLIYARDFAPSQGSSGSRGADLGVAPGN